jgi:hypothetical protein
MKRWIGLIKDVKMKNAALLILLITSCFGSNAQLDWKLKKDEDWIKVFTASTPNSDFKSIKVECTIKATVSQLVSFLMDVDKQHDWVYNNKTSQLLKKIKDNEMIFYSEVSVPWPCANRDYISHITVTQPTPQLVNIDALSEPNLLPQKEGKIRVKSSRAHWDITKQGADLLKIVYVVQFDPSGSVPAWLTNLFLTKGPIETFEKLRDGVSKVALAESKLNYITDL